MGDEFVPIGTSTKVEEIQARRSALSQANATPLPGSLKDAFAIAPEIKVGEFSVRPFYDGDFDILTSLENPLAELMAAQMESRESKKDYFPRGQTAYEICHLFTIPIEQALEEMTGGTFRENARKRFWKFQIRGLIALHNAVIQQMSIYWSTAIGFEADESSEGEGSKKNAQA